MMENESVIPAVDAPEPPSTLDRVLDEINKPAEPATPAPAAAPAADPTKPAPDAAKPDAAKPGEPAKPGDAAKPAEAATEPFKVGETASFKISDTAVKTREEIEKLPYANDATFKAIMDEFAELAQFKTGMAAILNDGAYKINDADTMRAVVADAFSLYDIINLKASPADLLDLAAKNYGEEQINQVVASILLYAEEKGITKEMYSDLSKPENKKIFDLSKESRERKAREATEGTARQQAEETTRKENDFKALETHVGKWAKENKIDETDVLDYLTFVVAQIGGDQKQLEALRAGKFGEVEKILTEYNNRMVERQKRWETALTDRKGKREDTLKGAGAPAGGGTPPKEPPKKKVNILDDDERMAAIKDALRG